MTHVVPRIDKATVIIEYADGSVSHMTITGPGIDGESQQERNSAGEMACRTCVYWGDSNKVTHLHTEPGKASSELPFLKVNGGPYDEAAYNAGFMDGRIDAWLGVKA